mmetsp:Transcript_115000/g.228913  ORF Transcript_115000/g.228913 Transcript_115000/m.228913 type:complete len:105 (-) Transcript_115000:858-1172(-)
MLSKSVLQMHVGVSEAGQCLSGAASPSPAGLPGVCHPAFSSCWRKNSCLTACLHERAHRSRDHGTRFRDLKLCIDGKDTLAGTGFLRLCSCIYEEAVVKNFGNG